MDALNTLLLVTPRPEEGGGSLFTPLLMMVMIFAVFYFLLIAPARRKQKQHGEMLTALKNGDRVVTNGGIYGTVVGVAEQTIQLRIADQVKIEIAKSAIADRQPSEK